eukprot:g18189.t1
MRKKTSEKWEERIKTWKNKSSILYLQEEFDLDGRPQGSDSFGQLLSQQTPSVMTLATIRRSSAEQQDGDVNGGDSGSAVAGYENCLRAYVEDRKAYDLLVWNYTAEGKDANRMLALNSAGFAFLDQLSDHFMHEETLSQRPQAERYRAREEV